jgi:hypothetical protein
VTQKTLETKFSAFYSFRFAKNEFLNFDIPKKKIKNFETLSRRPLTNFRHFSNKIRNFQENSLSKFQKLSKLNTYHKDGL